MAKSKALVNAEAQIAALEVQVAALEAKLTLARECWTNQRKRISELEAQLAAPGRGRVVTNERGTTTYYGNRQVRRYMPAHAQ